MMHNSIVSMYIRLVHPYVFMISFWGDTPDKRRSCKKTFVFLQLLFLYKKHDISTVLSGFFENRNIKSSHIAYCIKYIRSPLSVRTAGKSLF